MRVRHVSCPRPACLKPVCGWLVPVCCSPYIYDAVRLLDAVDGDAWPGGVKPDGLEFVHFPIVDCAVVSDARVLKLCKDLVKRLLKGENLYVHCWCVCVHVACALLPAC